MKTYQDLLAVGNDDIKRGEFCLDAVKEFRSSNGYINAKAGDAYYNKHNLTIEKYVKFLYTISGQKKEDIFSANHKLSTLFFRRLVMQQVQYVLGNGVNFDNIETKDKLGKDFDFQLKKCATRSMSGGKAFGFWNLDHLEVFGYADNEKEPGFVPLKSEDTAEMMAGIRYWYKQVGDKVLTRFTLYEPDGLTEYKQYDRDDPKVITPKQRYKRITVSSPAGGIESERWENYSKLPIVEMVTSDTQESELVGLRSSIDAVDFLKSGLCNTIDDTSGFFWLVKNAGGMDDTDLAQMVQRLKTLKAAVVDSDDGGDLTPVSYDIPVESRKYMIELLRKDIYEDFQALDVNTLSAAQKTTQEIQAAYQAQDNKCADFEYYIIDFVQKILELAGIDDNPTFNWSRVVNTAEQTTMILQAAQYLPPQMVIKKLPFLTPEEAEEAVKYYEEEQADRFLEEEEEESEEDEEEEETSGDE